MFEPGVMFWAERDNLEMALSLGVRYGQLGIPGGMQLTAAVAAQWKAALEAARHHAGHGVRRLRRRRLCQYANGGRHAWDSSRRLPASCALARTLAVSDFAAQLGVAASPATSVSSRKTSSIRITSPCARWCAMFAIMPRSHGQTFALETGQEPRRRVAGIYPRCRPPQPADQFRSGEPDSLRDR